MDKTDFYIDQIPVSIGFDCPHCGDCVKIPWDELNIPDYWGDDWGFVECPACGELVELGSYEIN